MNVRSSWIRDPAGGVTKLFLPSGRQTDHLYDACDRIAEVKHTDGTFARFAYDPGGALRAIENESTQVNLERDRAGRIVREQIGEHEVRSQYDVRNLRIGTSTSLGSRTSVARDHLGDVHGVLFSNSQVPDLVFGRDGLGLDHTRRYSNGIDVQWFRDKAGRPTVRRTIQNLGRAAAMATAMAGAVASQPAQAAPPRVVEQRNYTWRGEDQIASIAHAWSPTRTFDHDSRGRLIRLGFFHMQWSGYSGPCRKGSFLILGKLVATEMPEAVVESTLLKHLRTQ